MKRRIVGFLSFFLLISKCDASTLVTEDTLDQCDIPVPQENDEESEARNRVGISTISQEVYPPAEDKLYRILVACMGSFDLPRVIDNSNDPVWLHYRDNGDSCLSLSHNSCCMVDYRYAICTRHSTSESNPFGFACDEPGSVMAIMTSRKIYEMDGQSWILPASPSDQDGKYLYFAEDASTTATPINSGGDDESIIFDSTGTFTAAFVTTGCNLVSFFDLCEGGNQVDAPESVMMDCQAKASNICPLENTQAPSTDPPTLPSTDHQPSASSGSSHDGNVPIYEDDSNNGKVPLYEEDISGTHGSKMVLGFKISYAVCFLTTLLWFFVKRTSLM